MVIAHKGEVIKPADHVIVFCLNAKVVKKVEKLFSVGLHFSERIPMKVYLPVIRVLSMVIFIFGLTMLVPVGVSWVFQDGAARAFDEAILLTLGVGLVLWGFTRRNKRDLTIRDGFLMVALVWTVLPVFAALPLIFILTPVLPMPTLKPYRG